MKKILKSNMLRRIIAAVLIVGMMMNMEGIQGLGKLTVRAGDCPSSITPGDTYEMDNPPISGSWGGLIFVFCDDEIKASNAFSLSSSFNNETIVEDIESAAGQYGTVKVGSYSITSPGRNESNMPGGWVYYNDQTIILHGASTYYYAVYYGVTLSDPPVLQKPTYDIYCEYGNDADTILSNESGYFSVDENTDYLRRFGNSVYSGSSDPSSIGSPSYSVKSWDKVGENSSTSCNIAVYKAVYEGGIQCEADNGSNTIKVFKTEFSLDNSGDSGTIVLPTADEAGFGYAGHNLAGWSTEATETAEYLAGASFPIDRGNPRTLHAVWTAKTAVTLTINVNEPVYAGHIAGNISVAKSPTSATGTPTLEYKPKGSEDDAYSDSVPAAPGEYTVRATLEESDDYAEAEATEDFELLDTTATIGVTYKPNGGTGTAVTGSESVTLTGEDGSEWTGSITLLSAADAGFSRSEYKLAGWKEKNDPAGTVRLPGSSYTGITAGTGTLEFSAVWEEKQAPTMTIIIDDPVYEGTSSSILSKINVTTTPADGDVSLSFKADGATAFTDTVPTERGTYTVKAVLEESDDYKGTSKTAELVILPADVDVSVTYSPNGGNGTAVTQSENVDLTSGSGTITLLEAVDFTRANYNLVGWKDSSGTVYDLGESYTGITADTTSLEFEAVWEEKTAGVISISVASPIYEGDTVNIEVTENNSGGDVTYKYKLKAAPESAYSTTIPTVPGTYTVLAILAETDDYTSAETIADFEIVSKTLSVSITYRPNGGTGDTITQNKVVSLTSGKGEITLLSSADFKKNGYDLTGWKDQNGKTYSLGATYAVSSDNRSPEFDAVWTAKKAGSVDIDIKTSAYVGAKIKYDVDKNSDGDVKVEYKKKGEKDEKYSKDVPTEAGEYTVRVTLEETDEYSAAEDTDDFKIVYLDAPDKPYTYQEVTNSKGTVTDLTIVPATGYSISTSATASALSSIRYSTAKQAGGVCLIRDEDKATTDMIKLADYTASDAPSISVEKKFYYGVAVSATGSSLTPATLTIEYKRTDAADSAYSRTAPTEPGKYTVRLSAPASGFYAAVNETAYFSIEYLDAPSTKAGLQGTKGKGDWYTSDVTIVAPTGYLISTKLGEGYTSSISWHDGITKLYYMRTSDGAMTDAVEANFDVKIDKKEPKMDFDSSMELGLPRDGMTIYSNSITFTISDDNLKSVTVKGKTYTFSNGKCVVMLDAGLTTEPVEIIAKDEAGNEYTILIELCPAWMQDNVMPLGRDVLLTSGTEYSFAPGTRIMMNGDATVYEGGSTFYVRTTRTCNFSTK